MSATGRSSSARPRGSLHCVERCWRGSTHAVDGRPDARKRPTHRGHGQCRPGGERGSEVSLRGPAVLRAASVRISVSSVSSDTARLSRPLFACSLGPVAFTGSLLKALQLFQLVCAHSAISLAPAVIGLFDNTDPPDRVQTGQTLPHQNLSLPQRRDNLLRLRSLAGQSRSSVSQS